MSGTFTSDDQVQQFTVNLTQMSTLTAYTTSYASGGFVPILSLFNPAGNFVAGDGATQSCSNGRMMDATTGICNDAYLSTALPKGAYTLALTEFFNYPNGSTLADGFSEAGAGNFTGSVCSAGSGSFMETDLAPCVQRTGAYSLTLSTTATPEPATGWLSLPVVALAIYGYRRSKKRA